MSHPLTNNSINISQEEFSLPNKWKNEEINQLFKLITSNKYSSHFYNTNNKDKITPSCSCKVLTGCDSYCQNRLLYMYNFTTYLLTYLTNFFLSFFLIFF